MKFFKWLLKVPVEADDWRSEESLKDEIKSLRTQVRTLEMEVGHWKTMALNFKKHHQ